MMACRNAPPEEDSVVKAADLVSLDPEGICHKGTDDVLCPWTQQGACRHLLLKAVTAISSNTTEHLVLCLRQPTNAISYSILFSGSCTGLLPSRKAATLVCSILSKITAGTAMITITEESRMHSATSLMTTIVDMVKCIRCEILEPHFLTRF